MGISLQNTAGRGRGNKAVISGAEGGAVGGAHIVTFKLQPLRIGSCGD
jgi:hypothetical protein